MPQLPFETGGTVRPLGSYTSDTNIAGHRQLGLRLRSVQLFFYILFFFGISVLYDNNDKNFSDRVILN